MRALNTNHMIHLHATNEKDEILSQQKSMSSV